MDKAGYRVLQQGVVLRALMHRRLSRALVAVLAVAALPLAAAQSPFCPTLLERRVARLQDEKPQSLCQYAGKVLLVVNTASQCGYTPQYRQLEALYARYSERGLVVLGFPSNDFGGQEPGSNREIADFCENQFAVSFPMFVKAPVRGAAAQPLFADLKRLTGQAPAWNFHKFVVDRSGQSARAFASDVDPLSAGFMREIERLLSNPVQREKGRAP
jgi:glutathione peroxidase